MNKASYQELEKRIRELESESPECKRIETELLEKQSILRKQNVNLVRKSIELSDIMRKLEDKNYDLELSRSELEKAEEKYRTLTENSLTGIFIHQDGKYVFVNNKFAAIHGCTPEELLGREHWLLVRSDEREIVRQTASKRLNGEAVPQRYEVRRLKKDGRTIWCRMMATRIEYRGRPAIMGNIVDITELKRTEEDLQQSFEKLRKGMRGTIHAIASTVEMRDPHTSGHQERVAELARAIAQAMGLSKEQIDGIRMAGVIHDLGKISVPADILSKPGQLNEHELAIIKTHSQVGYDILKKIEFPWPIAQIILQHHERMDGSGHPHGLSGEEILIEARILGVADVVEAMASHRPYRPALGIDKALEEISINKGKLYDVEVANACLKIFKEKEFKFKSDAGGA